MILGKIDRKKSNGTSYEVSEGLTILRGWKKYLFGRHMIWRGGLGGPLVLEGGT